MPDSSSKNPAQALESVRVHGGFADLVGYELVSWQEDVAEVALVLAERHMNRSGVMHGGVLTTLVDTACGYCGCFAPEGAETRRAFSLSLTVNFIGTGRKGQRLTSRARRTGGGKSVFFADCQVVDEEGRSVGSGQGTFKYITLRK